MLIFANNDRIKVTEDIVCKSNMKEIDLPRKQENAGQVCSTAACGNDT